MTIVFCWWRNFITKLMKSQRFLGWQHHQLVKEVIVHVLTLTNNRGLLNKFFFSSYLSLGYQILWYDTIHNNKKAARTSYSFNAYIYYEIWQTFSHCCSFNEFIKCGYVICLCFKCNRQVKFLFILKLFGWFIFFSNFNPQFNIFIPWFAVYCLLMVLFSKKD